MHIQVLEAAQDVVRDEPPDRRVWERIVLAARDILGEASIRETQTHVELDHGQTGIQLSGSAAEAGITVPYWYTGADAEAVLAKIYTLGRVVESATGFQGFDPQLDLPLAEARSTCAVAVFDHVAANVGGFDD